MQMPADPRDAALPTAADAALAGLVSQVREAVVHVSNDWVVRYCNDVYLENIGLTAAQVIGRTPFEYHPAFVRSIFYENIEACRTSRRPIATIGFSAVLSRWLLVRVFPVEGGMLMLANDASESVVRQVQLAQRALKDGLTGLPNKLDLVQQLEQRLGRGEEFHLVILGINRFRTVNDSLGYARGDFVILEIASRLTISTLDGEYLCRVNGDEFGFIVRGGEDEARERTRALVAQTERPLRLDGQSFVLGASAGIVSSAAAAGDPELMLKRAAIALGQAKRQRRDAVVAYEPSFEAASRARAELEAELRAALDAGAFMLMLQPKGCLASGRILGAEALIRWPHPRLGMVPPLQFLPIAQECALMPALDRWVLHEALRQVRRLERAGTPMPVSINISAESLGDVGFIGMVRSALDEHGVPAARLNVEIPEGALMQDVRVSASVLEGLHALGVEISIDDFGTGYSSFAYLARFPVQTLKIDRSFVRDLCESETSRKIVRGVVRLAHSLAMRVVAEGAETPEQIEVLRRMRCDEVQGYGLARPLAIDAFTAFALGRQAVPTLDPMSI